jgi:LDH2 family malate/lactate/ureidoglycolate dehydrogenase
LNAGHKGYGLALLIEAFGDKQFFHNQMDYLVEKCINNKPENPEKPVRLPGQRGLVLKREQLEKGVLLHKDIMPALNELIVESGIEDPQVV